MDSALLPQRQSSSSESSQFKKITLWPLAALIFYGVSGGPFGIEDAVSSGGPILAILGFLIFPLFWSIPEALVTAELSCTFPEASGFVAWVDEAYGPYWGFVEGYLSWISGVADNALYPILFVDYLKSFLGHGDYDHWLEIQGVRPSLIFGVAFLLTYLTYRGLDVVGNTAIVLCFLTLMPFVVLVGLGVGQIDTSKWMELPNGGWADVQWRTYLNILFWNLNYWDSAASFAGEVQRPERNFPLGMAIAAGMVVLFIELPILVGVGVADENQDWDVWTDGYLETIGNKVAGGSWLGLWVLLASWASNIGQFIAEMSSDSFQLMGMAERGMLPVQFTHRSSFGTPTLAIIFSASGVVLLSVLSFTEVIEVLNFLYCFAQVLEFSAFISLRQKRPDLPRPYKIPVSTTGAIGLLALPTLTVLFVIAMSSLTTWLVGGALMLIGLVLYPFLIWTKENGIFTFISEEERKRSIVENDLVDEDEENKYFIPKLPIEGNQQPQILSHESLNGNSVNAKDSAENFCDGSSIQ